MKGHKGQTQGPKAESLRAAERMQHGGQQSAHVCLGMKGCSEETGVMVSGRGEHSSQH